MRRTLREVRIYIQDTRESIDVCLSRLFVQMCATYIRHVPDHIHNRHASRALLCFQMTIIYVSGNFVQQVSQEP